MLTETVEPSTVYIAQVTQEVKKPKKEKHLFHPVIDFLCLGGGSLILFVALALYGPVDVATQTASVITLTLATLINFPHFAHSYQIFYQNFLQKGFQQNGSRSLQIRYIFAGIVVPTAMTVFFRDQCHDERSSNAWLCGKHHAFPCWVALCQARLWHDHCGFRFKGPVFYRF